MIELACDHWAFRPRHPCGHKAKIDLELAAVAAATCTAIQGKLVLVTATTPADRRRQDHHGGGPGRRAQPHQQARVIALREPSMGLVFVRRAARRQRLYQVVPMEDINLHFTGDFSTIALATTCWPRC